MKIIDESAIQRMSRNVFALQQTLTNITMTREVALDHARHYFELFFLSPEVNTFLFLCHLFVLLRVLQEILNGIIEKGAEFSELEYMNALHLLHRSKAGKKFGDINNHMERLSNILEKIDITV